jgi:hypothetical protein
MLKLLYIISIISIVNEINAQKAYVRVANVVSANIGVKSHTSDNNENGLSQFRSSFKSCCALGKQASNSSCVDYSRLNDRSSACKFAYTICCSQNKRTSECDRGKKHALSGGSCEDLRREAASTCDSLTVNFYYLLYN